MRMPLAETTSVAGLGGAALRLLHARCDAPLDPAAEPMWTKVDGEIDRLTDSALAGEAVTLADAAAQVALIAPQLGNAATDETILPEQRARLAVFARTLMGVAAVLDRAVLA